MPMSAQRAQLKTAVANKLRKPWQHDIYCELCKRNPATDLHEHWISRGQSTGNMALQQAILNSMYNVSLLCNDCNINHAETEENRKLLRRASVERYGVLTILLWMDSLPFRSEVDRAQHKREVNNIYEEMQNEHE